MWGYVDFLVRSACHRVSDNPKLLLWITFGYTSNSPGWYKNTTCTKYIFYWTQYPQKRSRREVVPETAFQSFSDTIVSPIWSLWSQYCTLRPITLWATLQRHTLGWKCPWSIPSYKLIGQYWKWYRVILLFLNESSKPTQTITNGSCTSGRTNNYLRW